MCIFCEKAQAQIEGGFLTAAQKLEAEQCETLRDKRVKATILTGFLGSGKTTFLNFVLKSQHGKRIGVIQNEFGSVSVDDKLMLVEQTDTEVVTMANGCICCRVRGDMVDALKKLAARPIDKAVTLGQDDGPKLDGLIIECSGLSEVIPVAQTFFADPFVQASFHLDGVVCVCDAANFENWAGGPAEGDKGVAGEEVARLLREQLSISDVCLLNKCDLVTSAQRDKLSARMRELSPSIKVVPCRHGKVNLGQVLSLNSFSVETVLSLDSHFLGEPEGDATESSDQIRWCQGFFSPFPAGPRKAQGGNTTGRKRNKTLSDTEQQNMMTELANHARSPLDQAGGAAPAHAHVQFGSVGLQMEAGVDVENLKVWLRSVVENHGDRLVRIKGVLRSLSGPSAVIIVQGVGGHIEVGEEEAPEDKKPTLSRLVLIGRLLDAALREELRSNFLALGDTIREEKPAPAVQGEAA